MFALARAALLLFAVFIGFAPANAAASLGVVLLHGKTGSPVQFAKLSAALSAAGYAVAAPELCWSKKRIFDKSFADCMKEVDAAVDQLRSGGATAVVVAGASQGAVAALAYCTTRSGLAGIVAMAPAADPTNLAQYPGFAEGLKTANALVKAGKGDVITSIKDVVSGNNAAVTTTPNIYLSFHGPDSPVATIKGMMAKTLPHLKLPVLWISGTRDDSQAMAPAAFATIPKNALSRIVTVDADHAGTPDVSAEAMIAWLKTLQ